MIHHAEDVVLALHKIFKTFFEVNFFEDKIHLVVVLFLGDINCSLVASANLLAFKVDLIHVF